jgi:hypothetical protein
MKKIVSFIFLISSFLSFGEVILDSSNIKPAINEPFTIQVKFIDEDKKDYEIEGIENLQILSKGSQSKYSNINGKGSSTKIDLYTVMANEIKNFPLSVNILGKNEKSNTINIEVQEESSVNISEDMSMESSIKDGDSFYFGEKIVYEENFLTTVGINSIGYSRAPKFNAFSEKDMSPAILTGAYEQSYFRAPSGKQGLKINTYRGILQPNTSGEKIINSGQVAVTQSTGRRDFFFEESTPPKYFGGKNIKVNILPLPADKPIGFQNVVGTPKIEFSWNSDNANLGESVVLSVKISGNVNLDSLEKIVTKQFNDFNIFETLKNKNENINSGEYYSEKSFDIALIPKKSGNLIVPEITIPYFDTEMKAYKFLVIPSKEIKVSGNSSIPLGNQTVTPSNVTLNNITAENKPLEEIKIETLSDVDVDSNIENNYMIIGLIILVIVEGGIIVYLLTKKNKKSSSLDISELKKAKDDKEFYEAYCNFMKRKYNFSPKVHLEDRLVKLGLSPEFIHINRELENAHYNGTAIDRKDILKRLKKELKNEK